MSFKSFTIIEVLVSITVLLIVVFLPLGIISRLLIDNSVTRERIDARYRAQGIIEYVRQKRDTNFTTGTSETYWLEGFYDSDGAWDCRIEHCKVEYGTDGFISGLTQAQRDEACNEGGDSEDTLRIKVNSVDKLETVATISVCTHFEDRGVTKHLEIEETIYRWIRSKDSS